jgi:hypothetical protein
VKNTDKGRKFPLYGHAFQFLSFVIVKSNFSIAFFLPVVGVFTDHFSLQVFFIVREKAPLIFVQFVKTARGVFVFFRQIAQSGLYRIVVHVTYFLTGHISVVHSSLVGTPFPKVIDAVPLSAAVKFKFLGSRGDQPELDLLGSKF